MNRIKFQPFLLLVFIFISQISGAQTGDSSVANQKKYLEQIRSVLPPEKLERGRVSILDESWENWLERTGELPPDFETLPSLPFLPDPLVLEEGTKNIPVKTPGQLEEKRDWIRAQIKYWITGTFPPKPDNLIAKISSEEMDGKVIARKLELRFGPNRNAKLTVELMIPPGDGPFPVFMTQSNHRSWALIAVRRGYIGCTYAGNDGNDDTEAYAEIWYPEYDFTRLMRRAWGAHRVVDYLYTLAVVDKEKIAITGHSRNGKQALMAAAFDERITAVIPSSGGTGSEDPWRFNGDKFDNETIAQITTNFPHWMHPRLRFFVGREHKLPVDQNLMMALVAPRGLMLSSAITEQQGNPWGIEQNYRSVQPVYKFLDAENKLAIRLRRGRHGTSARDIESYLDFFDYAFGRRDIKPSNYLYYDYSFEKWLELSGEKINPDDFPEQDIDDLLISTNGNKITDISGWEQKKPDILQRIQWGLGEEPAGASNPGPTRYGGNRGDYLGKVIGQPESNNIVDRSIIYDRSGYRGFGDNLYGNLYVPKDVNLETRKGNLPVIIYIHEYSYPHGFARNSKGIIDGFAKLGFAVFMFDQIGFGTRIEEGTKFYQRYPNWSKMGKMVVDARAAVDAMAKLEIIDKKRILLAGYSLGATVGLYTAAFEERVAGVISVCGFTPMRLTAAENGNEGLKAFSHLHGLLPRLGFFIGHENRIPYDYHEILACIAPRPLLIIAPTWDRDAVFDDVKLSVKGLEQVYQLYGAGDKLKLNAPNDYNRFSPGMQKYVFEWLQKNF